MAEIIKKIFWRPIFRQFGKIRKWYTNNYIIPPYSEKRDIILQYKQQYGCVTFVETGTFMGDTIERMKPHFEHLYSIELAEELALKAQKRFEQDKHVTILQGDSGIKIGEIVSSLKRPVLYWLDGHYSGSCFIGEEFIQTAEADIHSPIMQELECILANGIGKTVILIDDARLFVGADGYPEYNQLVKQLSKYNIKPTQVSRKRDIIRIVPE